MSNAQDLAADYAKRYADGIRAMVTAGAAFGYRDDWGNRVDTLAEISGYDAEEHDADNLPDGWDTATAADFVGEALDLQYLVGSDRSYRHARVIVTVGGPYVYVDTEAFAVVVTWGSGSAREMLPVSFVESLDEYLGEYFAE